MYYIFLDLLFIIHDFVFSMLPVAISSLEIKSCHFVPAQKLHADGTALS